MGRSGFMGLGLIAFGALAACSQPADTPKQNIVAPSNTVAPPATVAVQAPAQPQLTAPQTPVIPDPNAGLAGGPAAINAAQFNVSASGAAQATKAMPDPVLIRAEVLLDRARFSPGVIDGLDGDNLRQAIAGFETAHGLPADGKLNDAVWTAMTEADPGPVVQSYTISEEDLKGPFIGEAPKDFEAMSKLPALGYTGPAQALAEKFHMDEALLKALNPNADFSRVGTTITVAMPRSDRIGAEVASIEVDKAKRALRAYDAGGKLLALYPASVGSTERPAPSGVLAVRAVAPRPAYYYDPKRLTFGRAEGTGRLKIAPGPNNPVGSTWIDLTQDTYGIHGSPDPRTVGKAQSHGCVRLTNWDVAELGKAVKRGTKVVFLGAEAPKPARKS